MKKPFINHMRFRLKRCFEKKSLKRGVISFAIGFGVFGFFSEQIHFIKSLTDSLPEHYFVQLPKRTPKMGDLKMPHFNYLPLFLGGNMSSQPQPGAN